MNRTEEQQTDQFKSVPSESNGNGAAEGELQQWLEEGVQLLESKEYKDAIRLFEKVLRVDPDNMTAFEKLSVARSVQGDLDRINEYLAMGQELMNQGDWKGAAEEFQAILSINPDHEDARMLLGQSRKHFEGDENEDEESMITTGGQDVFDLSSPHASISDPNLLDDPDDDQDTSLLVQYDRETTEDASSDPDFQRKLEEALRIYENGNLSRAKELLEELQKNFPGQAQVQFYLTAIARRFETDQIRSDQSNAETQFKQAMDLIEQKKFEPARSLLQEAVRVRPDFEQAQLMLERIDEMQKAAEAEEKSTSDRQTGPSRRKDKAGGLIKDNLPPPPPKPKTPGSTKAMMVFGGIVLLLVVAVAAFFVFQYPNMRFNKLTTQANEKYKAKAYIEAISLLESAVLIKPDSFETIRLLGNAYTESEQYLNAVEVYNRAMELQPNDNDLKMKIADCYYMAGKWPSAINSYKTLTGVMQYQEEALFKIAMSLKESGRVEDAIVAFRDTLAINDAHSTAHYQLAISLEAMEQLEEAEKEYHLAIDTDPKFVEGYETLSDFYDRREMPEKSAEVLSRLLAWYKPNTTEKSEKVAVLKFKLGEAQYASGAFEEAVNSFSSVILIKPSVDAFRFLGKAHYKNDKLTAAIDVWRRGLKLDEKDHDLYFQIAVSQYRLGDLAASEASYKDALRIKPDYVKALTNLGFLYYQKYDYEQAQACWKRSLDLNPEQEVVKRKLKEIEKK